MMFTATVARGCVLYERRFEKRTKDWRKDACFFVKDPERPKERSSKDAGKTPRKTVKNTHKDVGKNDQRRVFCAAF